MTLQPAPHEQRVLEEKAQLDERLGKLTAFFATPVYVMLPPQEQDLLQEQCKVMRRYSDILRQRICIFTREL